MQTDFVQNALSWGVPGQKWLDALPQTVAHYEQKWGFKAQEPFKLNYNYVTPVVLTNGSQTVLKIGFSQDKEFQSEMKALAIFDGDGVVEILKTDETGSAMLLELIQPGKPVSELTDDETATKIMADVIKKIHKPLPIDHSFPTVQDWAKAIPSLRDQFEGKALPIPENLLLKAEKLFEKLVATSAKPVLVHGDLHHDNVLSSDTEKWVAIDPKGVAAEPAYEVAAMVRNPYQKLSNIPDLKPLLEKRILILANELDLDPTRILEWSLAQTVLSAVWSTESGAKTPEHTVRVAKALSELVIE